MLAQSPSSRVQAAANNVFALALFAQLRQRRGNLCFSPFSIRTGLAMAYAGAQGETAVQMGATIGLSPTNDAVYAAQQDILDRLNAAGGGRYEMAIANSVWTQDGAPVQPAFLDRINRYYGGGHQSVDFRNAAEQARAAINRWIEDHTKQRIVDLIPAGGLDSNTRLVLANAVYFRGKWVRPFDPEHTRDEPFHLAGATTVRVPLMYQQKRVGYYAGPGYQAVQLGYEGGDLAMLVLLPNRKDGLQDLEDRLTVLMLEQCVTRMAVREIELYLPRFKVTWGAVDLRPALADLGMSLPFEPNRADFSGINGHRPPDPEALSLGAVFHKAFTEVNEQGTEAAAAQAEMLLASGLTPPPPPPVFRADHPFLYAIRDHRSGAILFLGRATDPTRDA